MIEILEGRQLFSTAALTPTPMTSPVAEPTPGVVEADATSAKKKSTARASFSDISFVHLVDKANPVLMSSGS